MFNIDDLTLGQIKEIQKLVQSEPTACVKSGMVGKYVVVRCKDAGVHAGILEWHNGRECGLSESRRLWYWKPAEGSAFLSGVSKYGIHQDSKVGCAIDVHLTENCEIILCSDEAATSIKGAPVYEP